MIGLVDRIKQADPDTHRAVKMAQCQNKPINTNCVKKPPDPAAIPAPEPAGMGPVYAELWNEAWKLADWIDDPDGAPLADRRAKLPELDDLRERMAEIEKQGGTNVPKPETLTATNDSEEIKQIKQPGTWHTWGASETTTRDRTPENCPAKCKRSGKCYALAYFKGKPGKVKDCDPEDCKHT
jgi:hypothetical protein